MEIILYDLEICALALLKGFTLKELEKLLPRNVKNRFKWKNRIYIQKQMNYVLEKFSDLGLLESKDFNDLLLSFFLPKQILVLSKKEKIVGEVRISKYGKCVIEKIDGNMYKISVVDDDGLYVKNQTGIELNLFCENILYSFDFKEFKMLYNKFQKKKSLSEEETIICQINENLTKSMWSLEQHTITTDGKNVNVLVWNEMDGRIEFCYTENKKMSCIVNIGRFDL